MRFRDVAYMLPKLHSLYLFPMILKTVKGLNQRLGKGPPL